MARPPRPGRQYPGPVSGLSSRVTTRGVPPSHLKSVLRCWSEPVRSSGMQVRLRSITVAGAVSDLHRLPVWHDCVHRARLEQEKV